MLMRLILRFSMAVSLLLIFSISSFSNNIFYEDNPYPPTAVCDGYTVASLNDQGIAKIFAESFNDGSHDGNHHYTNLWFKVIRMDDELVDYQTDPYNCGSSGEQWQFACDGLNGDDNWYNNYGYNSFDVYYDDFVKFCCDDVGDHDLMVIMRVFNKNPGHGPVDPDRMKPGGDLYGHYNDCMVNVEIQDKLPTHCVAPYDVWVDCDEIIDIWDLSYYGQPHIYGGGCYNSHVVEMPPIDHRTCGAGHIIRRWKVTNGYDHYGNPSYSYCEQLIKIKNINPFNEYDIIWPDNYESNSCGAGDLNPENLPARFSPRFRSGYNDKCTLLAYTYKDLTFEIVPDACFKILREWVVIDWCQYNPHGPWPNKGIWKRYQILKVADNVGPEFTSSCYDRVYCDSSAIGCKGFAPLYASVTDCTPEEYIKYEYFIDLNHNGNYDINGVGPSAAGLYPFGTHRILWRVEDRCGNESTCSYKFTVQDCKKPSPYCFSPTTVLMPSTRMISIWASDVDAGSFDNCSDNLILSFTSDYQNSQSITITCDDLVDVEFTDFGYRYIATLWVTEVFPGGRINQDFCTVPIFIQDNEEKCGMPSTTISGLVSNAMDGEVIERVDVQLLDETNMLLSSFSNTEGLYAFPPVYPMDLYHIQPFKNDDPLNGVSTEDIIKIQKHLFGLERFDSPYQFIAADIDNNQRISANDMLALRDLVLGRTDAFVETTSWKFIDATQTFTDIRNPWPLKERITFDTLPHYQMDIAFMGVKMGDIDGDAIANSNQDSVIMRSVVNLYADDINLTAGQNVEVALKLEDDINVEGFQLTVIFDAEKVNFKDINSSALNISRQNLGLNRIEEGILTISWNQTAALDIEKDLSLLDLQFVAKQNTELSDALNIGSSITKAEIYEGNEAKSIQLGYKAKSGNTFQSAFEISEFELFQNAPNPFKDETTFTFSLNKKEEIQLNIFDINGKQLKQLKTILPAGMHEYRISKDDLNGAGLYFFEIQTETNTAMKKFVQI